ncbi:hypothetical protein EUA61_03930 [TM7 phylum sp. oral taxon 346]|nr:hypothetical protein EUA61_03930 [TM7 phylum sp. oral taxon 346]
MKAVVKISGKQYIVSEKESLLVDLLPEGTKELTLAAFLIGNRYDRCHCLSALSAYV